MAIIFSAEFNIPESVLIEKGIFNAFLDKDSHFFINVKRLQQTNVPEFAESYNKINEYFRKICILLKNSKHPQDRLYREALRRFDFPEVNGINLGFSSGRRGAGFGLSLRKKIISDAYEIIQSGSEQPEIFHLTGLFEENVGPDRISDMIARIIYDDIIEYSKRIYSELGITNETYPTYNFNDGIPVNPYKRVKLLLLPVDIIHELPIAKCWDDVDRVCRENEAIRSELNNLVGVEWYKLNSSAKKEFLLDQLFKNPERTRKVIDSYKESKVESFDPLYDLDYLITYLSTPPKDPFPEYCNSYDTSKFIIENYKEWVEYHRGTDIIQNSKSRDREKTVQKTIYAVAQMYCKLCNWDISPEEDSGRGPVDFKISRGTDKTVIEIKLTSNQECVHGLEVQIEEYAKAESTDKKLFILVNTGEQEGRIEAVQNKHDEMEKKGLNPAEIIVIDARKKDSASKYRPQ